MKFYALKKKQEESIEEFNARFMKATDSFDDDDFTPRTIAQRYVQALGPTELRRKLAKQRSEDIEFLMQTAENEEEINEIYPVHKSQLRIAETAQAINNGLKESIKRQVEAMTNLVNKAEKLLEQIVTKTSSQQHGCTVCGRLNHGKETCWFRVRNHDFGKRKAFPA